MIIAEVVNLILDNLWVFYTALIISTVLSMLISYVMIRRFVSGMIVLQITFAFNFAVILFSRYMGYLGNSALLQFVFIEILVTALMFYIYRRVLAGRAELMDRISGFAGGKVAIAVVFVFLFLIMLNQYFVPKDGGSRIGYMVLWWFSYVRLIVSVVMPLCYFLAVNFLESRRYLLSMALMVVMVIQNATSGSKAGFIVGLLGMFMLHRDLNGGKIRIIRINPVWAAIAGSVVVGAVVLILQRRGATLWDILFRLVMHAEATIMVYLSADPTEACHGVTLFAALHRGIARLFNDPSATNIDTLFGFALSAIHYGANTLTGPNSSIPAYFACNFPGWLSLIGLLAVLGYVAFVRYLFRRWVLSESGAAIGLLPFLVASINTFPQDYYTGMSHLTTMAIISLFLVFHGKITTYAK